MSLPLSLAAAWASASEPSPSAAALELVNATPAEGRGRLLQPFTDEARSDWHYTPRQRSGIPWKDMGEPQRKATTALLRTALSAPGLDKIRAVIGNRMWGRPGGKATRRTAKVTAAARGG